MAPVSDSKARLDVRVMSDRQAMGDAAAADIAACLRERLAEGGKVRMIFAAAPSQSSTLEALIRQPGIHWGRVEAFHMDEYLGLPSDAPQRFGNWLQQALFSRLPFGRVHLIRPEPDPDAATHAYSDLLAAAPIDAVVLGIGVNGHLAFNDPPVADLDDPKDVKIVKLDDVCIRQQVDDGAFPSAHAVPRRAVTLTIPRLLRADRLFCVVPGPQEERP